MTPQTAQPGWYPDPHGQPVQRFYDGTSWTDHTQPYPSAADRLQVAREGLELQRRRSSVTGLFIALAVIVAVFVVILLIKSNLF